MKTNKEIAAVFNKLAKLMELWDENSFKIRSYSNAYLTLRKWPQDLAGMSAEQMDAVPGIGKAIREKIEEFLQTGTLKALEKYTSQTPEGVIEMLDIKGFGPKKVKAVWKDMQIETIGELLYACNENRVAQFKGFGAKTQQDLINSLEYYVNTRGQFLYAIAEAAAAELLGKLALAFPGIKLSYTGALRRCKPILKRLEYLAGREELASGLHKIEDLSLEEGGDGWTQGLYKEIFPVRIYSCPPGQFGSVLFETTGSDTFLQALLEQKDAVAAAAEESGVFTALGLPYWEPEMREGLHKAYLGPGTLPELIRESDIRGVVHNHSTYSDGVNTLREMAEACRQGGYEYLVISDHSRSAGYANGLSEERVLMQWREIEALNAEMAPFRIFRSIESDILSDGSLDYPDDLLAGFDLVIASIHSNLKMDQARATERLLKAIANPYTTILGHPTGRLLLSRPGYPIDHKQIIDACAAHGVAIEINANPQRLDIDYEWLPYAIAQGVQISINPDAHSIRGISDIRYGVLAARKGGLQLANCLNARPLADFEAYLQARRK